MKVVEHEHPLTLIDLHVQYQQEEDEEEGSDRTTKEGFHGVKCKRCSKEIHMYHRYYYKCSSCDFSLHKFCGELSTRLNHPSHPHPLVIQESRNLPWKCILCQSMHTPEEVCYICDICNHVIDVKCAMEEAGKKTIHHPSHPHLLTCLIPRPISCKCSACGEKHKGMFYQCTTCVGFAIHTDCAFLPETLLIQDTTYDNFRHTHPLSISYSFPWIDQKATHDPECRVCGEDFFTTWYLWIYKCDKCMYYTHLACALSRRLPLIHMTASGNNYKNVDRSHLLHLPFPDVTHSMPKHLFLQEGEHEVNLKHESHQHPLTLVNCNGQTSEGIDSLLLLKCYDPMKKTQLLCNGCVKPITSTMPFYKCDKITCNFALHEWCTRLSHKILNHPGHPQHTLHLVYSNTIPFFFGVFDCAICELPCNGFAYCCVECGYYVGVCCGFMPKLMIHEAHHNHLFSLVPLNWGQHCHKCRRYLSKGHLSFHCIWCRGITIHLECALLLPKAIRHKYDKHPMRLSYLPIENHKSEYFCEICEEDLNPHQSFYHCQHCAQSVHSACAPLILESEADTHSRYHWKNFIIS